MSRFVTALLLAFACAAAAVVFVASPVTAAPKGLGAAKPGKPQTAPTTRVGTLLRIESGKLIVRTYGKLVIDIAVPVDAKTRFEVEGDGAKLEQLKPGMQLVITPATGTAQKVAAQKLGKNKKKKDKKDGDGGAGKAK